MMRLTRPGLKPVKVGNGKVMGKIPSPELDEENTMNYEKLNQDVIDTSSKSDFFAKPREGSTKIQTKVVVWVNDGYDDKPPVR